MSPLDLDAATDGGCGSSRGKIGGEGGEGGGGDAKGQKNKATTLIRTLKLNNSQVYFTYYNIRTRQPSHTFGEKEGGARQGDRLGSCFSFFSFFFRFSFPRSHMEEGRCGHVRC